MTQTHPITPPPELVMQWFRDADHQLAPYYDYVAHCAAQWGADQEMEACIQLLDINDCPGKWIDMLRASRRPKPPSLKEQALKALVSVNSNFHVYGSDIDTIRRALEALDD